MDTRQESVTQEKEVEEVTKEDQEVSEYATWFLSNDKCMHSFPSGDQCVFCGVGK